MNVSQMTLIKCNSIHQYFCVICEKKNCVLCEKSIETQDTNYIKLFSSALGP